MNYNLILIAGDDADIRDILSVTLEAAGHRTVGAKDGHTAARILTVARPRRLVSELHDLITHRHLTVR